MNAQSAAFRSFGDARRAVIAGALLALSATAAYMVLRSPGPPEPTARSLSHASPASAMTGPNGSVPAAMPLRARAEAPPNAAAPRSVPAGKPPATTPAEMPYRFLGKVMSENRAAVLLFGRGRVVTLREPGALDDEYVVEAMFDEYLVVRHMPTSAGHFLSLVQRPTTTAPVQDPEDSPRD